MSVDLDLSQFHEIFYEESREGLEAMESGLLGLNIGVPDPEVINTIFRAAHSIKGAAGTFGFKYISQFTHVVESIMDEVRERKRGVTQELVDVLLKSVDCLRYMLTTSQSGQALDQDRVKQVTHLLQALPKDTPDSIPVWRINFVPYDTLLRRGNDPVRLFRELQGLGSLTGNTDFSRLPGLREIDPEVCYLSWESLLKAAVHQSQINAIFEWVEGDCNLEILPMTDRRQLVERRGRQAEEEDSGRMQEQASIRVNIGKIDGLINLVGEMVITQSILNQIASEEVAAGRSGKLRDVADLLERHTRELQEQAMRIRMLPIDFTFQRLPRLVRDLSRTLGKLVKLKIAGNATEVDKTVLEKIADPLVHLVRNALDHGIETPDERRAANKPEQGLIQIAAYQEGGNILIRIEDDGAGLNLEKILHKAKEKGLVSGDDALNEAQILGLIFEPGFSTAAAVSDISGRGVGMDVVKRNINDLGGNVEVASVPGRGSTFTIRLPLSLAILDGQLVRVGREVLVIPMLGIVESVKVQRDLLNQLANEIEVYSFRNEYVPVLRLYDILGLKTTVANLVDGLLVVVDSGQRRVALFVEEVLGQQQVVIKSLEMNFHQVPGLSGATMLGDGTIAMILDVPELIQLCLAAAPAGGPQPVSPSRRSVSTPSPL